MHTDLERLSTHGTPITSRRCAICAGPIVLVVSRKHRRTRCAACGVDVELAPPHPRMPTIAPNERRTGRVRDTTRSLRSSFARAVVRNRAALAE